MRLMWIEFLWFQWAEINNCDRKKAGGHFPKYAFALWQVRINNCIFFRILTDYSNNAQSNPFRDTAWSACTCPWEHAQSAIAGRLDLTHAIINPILGRHAATGTWVSGKSKGVPQKTTPYQDRVLLRMVRQDRFISARSLVAWMRNLYEMRAGEITMNNQLLPHGYRAYKPARKPLLTANHHRLHLEWIYSIQAGGGSVHIYGAFHSGAKSPFVLPDRYFAGELYRGNLQNTLVPFARQHFGITTATKMITPHLTMLKWSLVSISRAL